MGVDTQLLAMLVNKSKDPDYSLKGACDLYDPEKQTKRPYNKNPFGNNFISPAEVERTMNLEFLMDLMPNP